MNERWLAFLLQHTLQQIDRLIHLILEQGRVTVTLERRDVRSIKPIFYLESLDSPSRPVCFSYKLQMFYLVAEIFCYVAGDLSVVLSDFQGLLHQTFSLCVFVLVVDQLQSQHGHQNAIIIRIFFQGSTKLFSGWWFLGIPIMNILKIRAP